MQLSVTPMIPGAASTLTVAQAPVGAQLSFHIGGDFQPGEICPPQYAPDCLDLRGPEFVSNTVTVAADRTATWQLTVPPTVAPGTQVGVQAAVRFAGRTWLSDIVDVTVLDGTLDSDGDGLTDAEEAALGTDPLAPDSDFDRITDLDELFLGLDPLDPDVDDDLLDDGLELDLGTDPLDPDTDNDNLQDGWEALLQLDPLDADTDDDGLTDGSEIYFTGTDPARADSDGDACRDGADTAPLQFGPDTDGDDVADGCDVCVNDPDNDRDGDGVCGDLDVCDGGDDTIDTDDDTVPDDCDPCPFHTPDDPDGDGFCGLPNRVFTTAGLFDGDLGGVPGADASCNDAAAAAALGGAWRAYLAVDTVRAGERIVEASSPNQWVRLDGAPAFSNPSELLGNLPPTAALSLTETGGLTSANVWTGVNSFGSGNRTCDGWTSSTSSRTGTYGRAASVFGWSNSGNAGCNTLHALYCFEVDDLDGDGCPDPLDAAPGDDSADTDGDGVADDCDVCPDDATDDTDGDGVCDSDDPCPLDAGDDSDGDGVCDSDDPCPDDNPDDPDGDGQCGVGYRAFVTAQVVDGDFGGGTEADTICNDEAPGGTWVAWLSEGGFDAASRLAAAGATGPWSDLAGRPIADDLADLTDGTLDTPLFTTPIGPTSGGQVWTGSATDGTRTGRDCNQWAGGFLQAGTAGELSESGPRWTDDVNLSCASAARLYCFEVP
jgi:hypothetical protein